MVSRLKSTQAGFTLVELVIVIAIIGILAGVSVPVYSGYVGKAQEAADLQLLSAMNTAFSAACAEMGISPTDIADYGASLVGGDNNNVAGIRVTDPGYSAMSDALNGSFLRYFGDNSGSAFRYYTVSDIFYESGVFTGSGNVFAGKWAASNFAGDETILLGALDTVSNLLGNSGVNGHLKAYLTLASKVQNLEAELQALPEEYRGMTAEELKAAAADAAARLQAMDEDDDFDWDDDDAIAEYEALDALVKKLGTAANDSALYNGLNSLGLIDFSNAMKGYTDSSKFGNATVLYVASEASDMNPSSAYALMSTLKSTITNPSIADSVNGQDIAALADTFGNTETSMIANMALAYSLATGYYNSDYYSGDAPTVSSGDGMQAMLTYMQTAMSDSGFDEYYQNDGLNDTAAFISAMQALNDNRDSISTGSGSAFNNDGTIALLNSLLGN